LAGFVAALIKYFIHPPDTLHCRLVIASLKLPPPIDLSDLLKDVMYKRRRRWRLRVDSEVSFLAKSNSDMLHFESATDRLITIIHVYVGLLIYQQRL